MQEPIAPVNPILAVLVHVPDVAAGLGWYQTAFPESTLKTITLPQTLHYLDIGGVMLEIVPADDKVTHAAAGSVVYWRTPNVMATLAHFLSVGATLYRGRLMLSLANGCAKSGTHGATALASKAQLARVQRTPLKPDCCETTLARACHLHIYGSW
jgi:hypothetical protein